MSPCCPGGPRGPGEPEGPVAPCNPGGPAGPVGPGAPVVVFKLSGGGELTFGGTLGGGVGTCSAEGLGGDGVGCFRGAPRYTSKIEFRDESKSFTTIQIVS